MSALASAFIFCNASTANDNDNDNNELLRANNDATYDERDGNVAPTNNDTGSIPNLNRSLVRLLHYNIIQSCMVQQQQQ